MMVERSVRIVPVVCAGIDVDLHAADSRHLVGQLVANKLSDLVSSLYGSGLVHGDCERGLNRVPDPSKSKVFDRLHTRRRSSDSLDLIRKRWIHGVHQAAEHLLRR
jgi:hypothetical protein